MLFHVWSDEVTALLRPLWCDRCLLPALMEARNWAEPCSSPGRRGEAAALRRCQRLSALTRDGRSPAVQVFPGLPPSAGCCVGSGVELSRALRSVQGHWTLWVRVTDREELPQRRKQRGPLGSLLREGSTHRVEVPWSLQRAVLLMEFTDMTSLHFPRARGESDPWALSRHGGALL